MYKSTFSDGNYQSQVPGLIELLVYGDGTCGNTVDLRGFILDDNNGELLPPQDSNLVDGSTLHVDPGYIQFADHPNWAAVPNGSIITIYESTHALNVSLSSQADPTDANQDFHYLLALENATYFSAYTSSWDVAIQATPYNGTAVSPSWSLLQMDGGADAMQVRYPEEDYCHGFAYGKTTTTAEENLFPLHLEDAEYAYGQIEMQEFSYLDKTAFEITATTGGFVPGQITNPVMDNIIAHLRDCNIPLAAQVAMQNPATTKAYPLSEKETTIPAPVGLEVFPNPFERVLQVLYQSEIPGTGTIVVYDNQGRMIERVEVDCSVEKQNISIDFGPHPTGGLFLIQFQSPNGTAATRKALLIDRK